MSGNIHYLLISVVNQISIVATTPVGVWPIQVATTLPSLTHPVDLLSISIYLSIYQISIVATTPIGVWPIQVAKLAFSGSMRVELGRYCA